MTTSHSRWRALTAAVAVATVGALIGLGGAKADPISDAVDALPLDDATLYGGPMVLMGIDAEDGGPGAHGPIENYEQLTQSVLGNVGNGGSGILVVGGGKSASDSVTLFWNQIGADISVPIAYVNTPEAISAQSFGGYAVMVVASSTYETYGGLTQAESDALGARADEVAAFINGGGGFVAFTQESLTNPLSYISGLGTFVETGANVDSTNITPTADGEAVGVTDALDVCCWHTSYEEYPDYLTVLANYASTGGVAALGGASVTLCQEDGFGILADGPLAGVASGTVHNRVEPVAGNVHPALQEVVHSANCTLVVPAEDAVDGLVAGNPPTVPDAPGPLGARAPRLVRGS